MKYIFSIYGGRATARRRSLVFALFRMRMHVVYDARDMFNVALAHNQQLEHRRLVNAQCKICSTYV